MNSRVLPIFAIALAIAIFIGYINPAWTGTIAEKKMAIAADDQSLASAKEFLSRQNQLAASRDAIDAASLTTLANFLPDSVNNVGIILDLNALAARSGLLIENADVVVNAVSQSEGDTTGTLPASGNSPVGSVDLSLSAVGTFSALQAFLNGIERSARLLDVQDLVVKSSDTGVYSYQMRIRLYWLR